MNPKDKAFELYFKYYRDVLANSEKAKQCALIAVNEMIKEYQSMSDLDSILFIKNEHTNVVDKLVYWQEVKQEIEKL